MKKLCTTIVFLLLILTLLFLSSCSKQKETEQNTLSDSSTEQVTKNAPENIDGQEIEKKRGNK